MDLIDRKAAIEAVTQHAKFLWENYRENCNLADIIDAMDNVPSVPYWIPCKAKLPDDERYYLWCDKNGNEQIARFKMDIDDHFYPSQHGCFKLEDAVAWAERPEPYREE